MAEARLYGHVLSTSDRKPDIKVKSRESLLKGPKVGLYHQKRAFSAIFLSLKLLGYELKRASTFSPHIGLSQV
jgi:hypothetical protein